VDRTHLRPNRVLSLPAQLLFLSKGRCCLFVTNRQLKQAGCIMGRQLLFVWLYAMCLVPPLHTNHGDLVHT